MGRPRTTWAPDIEARIADLARKGHKAVDIVRMLGMKGQESTIKRRLREAKAGTKAPPKQAAPASPAAAKARPSASATVEAKATPADRQIDGLLAGSLVFRLMVAAVSTALAPFPAAALAVTRSLRAVDL